MAPPDEAAGQSHWTRSPDKTVEEVAAVLLGKVDATCVRVAVPPNETRPGRLLTLGEINRIKKAHLHLGWPQKKRTNRLKKRSRGRES